jgi:hypothetical protein
MRRLLVSVCLVLTACGASPEEEKKSELESKPTDPSPSPDATPSPSPEPSGPTLSFANDVEREWTGTGDKVVTGVDLKEGLALFSAEMTTGTSNFIVKLNDPGGQYEEGLANEIGPAKVTGTASIEEAGQHSFEVKADGAWVIKQLKGQKADSMPTKLSGTGTFITAAFPLPAKTPRVVSGTYQGSSNFIVKLINANTGEYEDGLFNEIGNYTGEAQVSAYEEGYYLFEIDAKGSWTIEVK